MPRTADPANAKQAEAMRVYRGKLKADRVPEVDAVDTALASALAVFLHLAGNRVGEVVDRDERAVLQSQLDAVAVLEKMAARILASKGYDRDRARRKIGSRIRRLDAEAVALRAGLIASQS